MQIFQKTILCTILLLSFITLHSEEVKIVKKEKESKIEGWYTLWGIGLSKNTYPKIMENDIKRIANAQGVEQLALSIDMLGFYWPVNDRTILGFIINGSADSYTKDNQMIQLNHYIYGVSTLHYLDYIGKGFFVRGDLGMARMVVVSTEISQVASTDWGYGLLAGAGYGLEIFSDTRILFNLNYAYRNIENESYSSLNYGISFLF